MSNPSSPGLGPAGNADVDYVISYRFTDISKSEASNEFEQLVHAIAAVGLETEVRNGDNCSLLLFIRANDEKRFTNAVYKARMRDWLHGVRPAQPDREAHRSLQADPLTEAERYRLVHHLITAPSVEGGAGITPKTGKWKNVESLFPLHNPDYNKKWIKRWSTKTFLNVEDLDEIRDKLGEKIAFYFAFTQSYFAFLLFPAIAGVSATVLLGTFSPIYAVVSILWCVTFLEYWKHQELELGVRWGVRGVSAVQEERKNFEYEKEVKDPLTGELVKFFPARKRLARQLLQVPFALLAALLLGSLIITCFGIEVFISEVYNGPFKGVLVFLPTALLTVFVPTISTVLTTTATKLNDFENHKTTEGYESALTAKLFIINFITSYLGICLTAFVYVPFGSIIVPYLDVFHVAAKPFATDSKQLKVPKSGFEINPDRLRKQVIYFTVTAQIVNFMMEVVVPYVKRAGFDKMQEVKAERAAKKGGATPGAALNDHEEEATFLKRVRHEASLPEYNVTDDLREMVVQFGYMALFSVVWPLTPLSFLANNWVELRSDAVKICIEMQRPTPYRADSIGPWLDSLGFLTWLGSITTSALVYMFSNDGLGPDGSPAALQGWALLLTIFVSEHLYLVVRLAVRFAVRSLYSDAVARVRGEQYMVRKRALQAQYGSDAATMDIPLDTITGDSAKVPPITRASLEEDARAGSLHGSSPVTRFWSRQKGWQETVQVGSGLIDRMQADRK